MEYGKIKIVDLIKKSEDKKLLLPNFQREFVWERTKNQKELLASILYDIPIGSLLILNGKSNFFATEELCRRKQCTDINSETTLYLLDGQQRVSTLKSIFFDFFKDIDCWKDDFKSLYPKLRTRWFLKIEPENKDLDLFGWNKLKFEGKSSLNNYTPNDILKYIHYEIINQNQNEKWYHPEYKKEIWFENGSIKNNKRVKIISEEAAIAGLIPLHSLMEDYNSSSLHYKVLNKIVNKRIETLKAEVEDDQYKAKEIFDEVDDFNELSDADKNELWKDLGNNWEQGMIKFLLDIREKEIPIIELTKDEMSRAIYTFEYVNKGGTALSTYDLVVAKSAHDKSKKSLTERISHTLKTNIQIPDSLRKKVDLDKDYMWSSNIMDTIKDEELSVFTKNQYLNLLSIFSYCKYETEIENIKLEHIKKDKQLDLTHENINNNTEITINALVRACAFLQFRCGLVKVKDLNYQLMILPIAYILKNDEYWNNEKVLDKIEYWYWSSLFGGAYRERPNEQCIEDIKKLFKFIKNGINSFEEREKRILNIEDYSNYNTLIYKTESKKIPEAIRKGLLHYILSRQPKDFLANGINLNAWEVAVEKEIKFDLKNKKCKLKIQDHHICPLKNATEIGKSSKELRNKKDHILNSPLNRTYISSIANNAISDNNPQKYFKEVSELAKYGHCIPCPVIENYKALDDEAENIYYERIMKKRYDEILRDLSQQLDKLK